MIETNNEKTFICVSFCTADEKLCKYGNFFGEKSKNQDKLIQSRTPGQHTKNQGCPGKTGTVGMFVYMTPVGITTTKGNCQKLEDWLKSYYAFSTFNACSHQPLSMMDTKPLCLMIKPNANWSSLIHLYQYQCIGRKKLKAKRDQDVQLGVVEPVPIGEPVTWCHRMVVCAKKNGSSRQTVDFQTLNTNAARETHHTRSLYQACFIPSNRNETVLGVGIVITVFTFMKMTITSPISSHHGDAIIIKLQPRVASPQKMATPITLMTKCLDDFLLWSDDLQSSFFLAVDWLV